MSDIQRVPDYTPASGLLADRVVLITGAGAGIGAALARTAGAHGATVVLLGKTVSKLEAVYDLIKESGGPEPAIYPMDLEGATPQDHEDLAATLRSEFGRLDGLVHNAATLGTLTPLHQYDVKTWSRVMQINLNAPFLMTRACLGLLKESADASLVFSSADVGRQGRAYWGAYAVAHAGGESMMQVLADELEANTAIRVNSIDPGPVRTALRREAYPGEDERLLPTPDAVVAPYLYLLGPDSRGITGRQFAAQ